MKDYRSVIVKINKKDNDFWYTVKNDTPNNARPVLIACEPLFPGANYSYKVGQYLEGFRYTMSDCKIRDAVFWKDIVSPNIQGV